MEYSGSEYEGTYDAGRFSGNGTYTYPDGLERWTSSFAIPTIVSSYLQSRAV